MGLFDSAFSMLSGASGANRTDPKAAVMQAAIGLLFKHEGGAAAGMQSIINALQNAGLADQVASWCGNEQNLPVTGEQIQLALGSNGMLRQLADGAGLPHEQVAGMLAEMLPKIIGKFSQLSNSGGGLTGFSAMSGLIMGPSKT